jgi:hypothetical protein
METNLPRKIKSRDWDSRCLVCCCLVERMIATIVVLKREREREIATIMELGSNSAESTGQLGPRTIQLGLMGLIESHAGHPGPLYSVSAFFFLFETNSVKYLGLNLSLLFFC